MLFMQKYWNFNSTTELSTTEETTTDEITTEETTTVEPITTTQPGKLKNKLINLLTFWTWTSHMIFNFF